jgi:hypothetical protein
MTKIFCADRAAPMSPRTVKYVEAMIREGDNFAYDRWLKRVREEEAQAHHLSAASASGQNTSVQRGNQNRTSDDRNAWPRAASALIAKAIPVPKAICRSAHDLKGTTSKARLRRWLEKVRVAWDDFQASRARDAVYDYLEAVFAVVMHYKVCRRTNRLLRHAFAFADLSFEKKPIHSLPSFAARVTIMPIARQSANGRERSDMSLIASRLGRG